MQPNTNKVVLLVSGLLTLIVLFVASLGVALHNGWLRTGDGGTPSPRHAIGGTPMLVAGDAPAEQTAGAPEPLSIQTSVATGDADTAAYRQKLDEAYKALDEAYGQITTLQAAQAAPSSASGRGDRASFERGGEHRSAEHRRRGREVRDGDDD